MQSITSALIAVILVTPCAAGITQVVLFTGFGAGPGPNTGMDLLNTRLAAAGIPDYLGQVFEWDEHDAAFDWVQQHSASRSTLVIAGHSFGGNSALQLAENYLSPVNAIVDLTIQIDPVDNFYFDLAASNVLPGNVEVGFNYYQISTGFFEPQGEDVVVGATNFNAEVLFNDTSITHTSIDDDARLHARIAENILANLNPASADFDGDGYVDGRDFLAWQRGESPNRLSAGDLALWQEQFGGSQLTATIAVPEPSGHMLFAITLWVTACRQRRACLRRAPPRGQLKVPADWPIACPLLECRCGAGPS
jgi:hypothetical protein